MDGSTFCQYQFLLVEVGFRFKKKKRHGKNETGIYFTF